ncbi:hypothetical protein [Streptomyces sp. 5-10]|uniref:hypothetical protein n=1 Tax=Streptomyces sp. 5-10 TaxID=878925 RepID=UPI00168B15C7|nr:hypothetical protein [Streptomyces sp. 5-10]MBD3004519.1 hypothetical protein [Streptomyces sp. 5-10]
MSHGFPDMPVPEMSVDGVADVMDAWESGPGLAHLHELVANKLGDDLAARVWKYACQTRNDRNATSSQDGLPEGTS